MKTNMCAWVLHVYVTCGRCSTEQGWRVLIGEVSGGCLWVLFVRQQSVFSHNNSLLLLLIRTNLPQTHFDPVMRSDVDKSGSDVRVRASGGGNPRDDDVSAFDCERWCDVMSHATQSSPWHHSHLQSTNETSSSRSDVITRSLRASTSQQQRLVPLWFFASFLQKQNKINDWILLALKLSCLAQRENDVCDVISRRRRCCRATPVERWLY